MTMNLLEELRTITDGPLDEGRRRSGLGAGSSIHYGDPEGAYGEPDAGKTFATSLKTALAKEDGVSGVKVTAKGGVISVSGGMGGNDFAVVIDTEEQAGRFNVAVTVGKALVSSAFVPANDPTKWVIDTVNAVKRGVARHGKSTFSIGEDRFFERAADPADEAATLIKQGAEGALNKMFQSRLDDILKAFKDAQKQMDGLRRVGAGNTEAGTLLTPIVRKLRELEQFAGKAADHAVKVGELREEEEDDEDEEDDDEEDDEDEDGDTCEACGCGGKKKRKRGMAEGATEGARSKGTGYGRGETEIAAVKDLINMMIQDAPDGHVVDLADFAKTMGGPAGKAVKKYLPSLMGVGGAWTGNATLVWPKDEKGNYDKSKFVVMRKGGKK